MFLGNDILEFTRISIFRMCEHYLPKLKIALDSLDKEALWKHEKETHNSIGGIVLHVGQHIQRHITRYSKSGNVEGGIEDFFPDEVALSSKDLIIFITERFNSWREVMTVYIEGDRDERNLDMFDIYHLVEHTSYHLGQIIDKVQRLTDMKFQFVQNGINETSLKALIAKNREEDKRRIMKLYAEKINEHAARDVLSWMYDEPFDFYNNELTTEALWEMLNNPYYAVMDTIKGLVGFFCYGNSAKVSNDFYIYSEDFIDIGLGLRPELTGKKYGKQFFSFVLEYMNNAFKDKPLRLTVAKFNQRAIRLYENFGFTKETEFKKDSNPFIIMTSKQKI